MFKPFSLLVAFVLTMSSAFAQIGADLLNPVGIQKAAQELTIYMRAGEICGFKNHRNAPVFVSLLSKLDEKATEMGIAAGGFMVDGMLARIGKKRMCAEAKPPRAGHERLLDTLDK